ncbi:MAG TPA: 2-amino-4-hydroxy-6-hydroxymethyldihydropteridine diphosphokinase [Burkholderiales bacterium]|jgi:2-amino-4-hydroxy-6-hydroxymethyldihydropteridine diphosphokinase|nr:2-amino-4-hydroxy-6-hydroxymethyldihydropteridine diphosphokinase [Burkholderiales bacterium]
MSATPPRNAVVAFIGIGANLDDPIGKVRIALNEIDRLPATRVVRRSSLYRTAPVGYNDQPEFINAVAEVLTELEPRQLLDMLLAIEARHGRVRGARNAPRTLDLDVLLFGDRILTEPELSVPHPRMHERAFVLVPLAEIAPHASIPGHGSAAELAARVARHGVTLVGPA